MRGAPTVHLPRIPTSPTRAIGREHEIAVLVQTLREGQQRLVTLTGPGGVGKSALALATGAALALDLPAIGYIDFGVIGRNEDPADHLDRVLRPGVPGAGGSGDDLATLLNLLGQPGQPYLLIWDTFEHLVHRAGFAADLLAACPQLTLLVTSRTPLRIRGEREFPVPPLAVPLPDADLSTLAAQPPAAVALFVERAQAARPDFALTAANAADIAAIVRRLDGLPLAIELAATRVKLLPPAALLRQLDARPDLLSGGPRDAPDRQQTLHNTVAWSYDLLDKTERAVFRRVATIPGDWPLDAALAVADCAGLTPDRILHALSSLIEHHLVDRVNAFADGAVEPRFSMRASIRSFGIDAAAAAAETAEAHRRHAAWVLTTAEAAALHLAGPDQAQWLDQLERDRTSLVAAQRWLTESGHYADSLRLAAALARFWSVRGHREEERSLLAAALADARQEIDPPLRVRALRVLGNLWYDQGHCAEARASYLAALDLLGSDEIGAEHANLWSNLTLIDLESGALDKGIWRLHDVIAVRRALDQPRSLGHDLNLLGEILLAQGEIGAAIDALDEALRVLTDTGDLRLLAVCLALRGEAARRTHDLPHAYDSLHRGLALAREIGDCFAAAAALGQLARLAEDEGDPETGLGLFHDALMIRLDQGDLASARPLVEGLARCVATYAPDLAAALHNAAVRGPSDATLDPGPWLPDEILAAITDLRQALRPTTTGDFECPPVDDPAPEDTLSSPLITTFRLSKREIEVLRLLASGITDREIAEALAISQRTATWHVTNVYDKLGVNSRLEAGIVAAQQGLV